MGKAEFSPALVPVSLPGDRVVDTPAIIGGVPYRITCLSVGNPHCVVFLPNIHGLDLQKIGPQFEHDPMFPERVNTEFVLVMNENTIAMRVWERGNGETQASGTGACAAAVAAVEKRVLQEGRGHHGQAPGRRPEGPVYRRGYLHDGRRGQVLRRRRGGVTAGGARRLAVHRKLSCCPAALPCPAGIGSQEV
jgi:hypothetical protein